jgi:hypothetical protein
MGKGWGYGRNSASLADKLRNNKTLVVILQDGTKVYKSIYKDNIYNYTLTIRYFDKRKIIVISGLYKPINYNVSQFKNQKDIYNYIAESLIKEYHIYNRQLEYEYFESQTK